jgi:hypothetical protein
MTDHTSWGPDEWIDPYAPVDRLRQMPLLAAQARLLGQTRNPSGDRRSQTHAAPGSRPAARLDLIDVADDTTEAHGELRTLILWCSRPIWEGVDLETRQAHPQPLGTPTWETETEWLAGIWQTSRAQLDEVELDMTKMTLDDTYRELCKAVGLSTPKRIPCPHDGCQSHLMADGDMMVCEATRWKPFKHEYDGPERLMAKWMSAGPMTASDLAAERFPVNRKMLSKWAERHKIKPAEKGGKGRPDLYRPRDVIAVLWPDTIDGMTRDAA